MEKRNKIIYWIATLWLSLGMFSTGLVQLLSGKNGPSGADSLNHLGYPAYFMLLIGTWKILGVVAVLIPGYPRLKEWAYAGFFFAMSGALVSHLAMRDGFGEVFPSVLLLVLTTVSWYFRPAGRKLILVHP